MTPRVCCAFLATELHCAVQFNVLIHSVENALCSTCFHETTSIGNIKNYVRENVQQVGKIKFSNYFTTNVSKIVLVVTCEIRTLV